MSSRNKSTSSIERLGSGVWGGARRSRSFVRTAASVAVLLLVLTGCAGGADDGTEDPVGETSSPSPEPTSPGEDGTEAAGDEEDLFELVVTSGGICICHAPLFVGIEEGIFEKHGLQVDFLQVSSGFEAMGALHSGDAHVGDAVVAVAAQAAQQGVEVIATIMANGDPTGTVDTSEFFAIVAHPDAGIEAGDLEGLRGKTIGVPTKTIGHQYLFYTLQEAGIDPEEDVNLQHVAPPDLPSALQSGSVDAVVAWEPIPLNALRLVEGSIEVTRGGGAIDYLFQRWMSPVLVRDNPEVTQAFVTAYAEAMAWSRENLDATAEHVQAASEGDLEVIREALNYLNFDPRVSQYTLDAAEQGIEFTQMVGALEGEFDFTEYLNVEFLRHTQEQYPEFFEGLPEIPSEAQLAEQ